MLNNHKSFARHLAKDRLLLVLTVLSLLAAGKAQANPIPDSTLPMPSQVGCIANNCTINLGTTRGSNLFHSFTRFDVPTGGTAFFNNDAGIANIISRVTGGFGSNIDGVLRANGTANLFLLNPNGIVFGTNARLDLGGSFIASTASSIKFADGTFYNANNSQTSPVLTVSIPVGLGFNQTPGTITVQGQGTGLRLFSGEPVDVEEALRVGSTQTLALVGGDIVLQGGTLKTPGGRIELGSVGEQSFVSLTPISKGWALGYDAVSVFRNISFSDKSIADASGLGGGDIQVQAGKVILNNASAIQATTLGAQPGGTVAIRGSESVELRGESTVDTPFGPFPVTSTIGTGVFLSASGNGGDLTISTRQLLLDDGAQITGTTFPLSTGNAGDLTINTDKLIVRGGSQINAATVGSGAGGNLTVNAADSIQLIGTDPFGTRSGLFTISVGTGDAGNITINTSRLSVRDGARVSTSTRQAGNGGTLTVNASDSVELSGFAVFKDPSGASPDVVNPSGLFALSGEASAFDNPELATGAGGSARVNTGQLTIRDGAQLSVSAIGPGTAGDLNVDARSVLLDTASSIRAETRTGTGGNLNLRAGDLRLRNNSNITTSAAETATGGNLTLNADTIVALENSDITANAVQGRGGNIDITTQGIFGTEFRQRQTTASDITASSEAGLSGVVDVQTLGFDVSSTLVVGSGNFISTEDAIAGSCLAQRNQQRGTFVVTGTGGLIPTPYDAQSANYDLTEVRPISGNSNTSSTSTVGNARPTGSQPAAWKIGDPIVEGRAIVVTADGRRLLVAAPGENAPPSEIACNSTPEETAAAPGM